MTGHQRGLLGVSGRGNLLVHVRLTVARFTDDHHVIAVGGTTRPISTLSRVMEVGGNSGYLISGPAALGGVPLYTVASSPFARFVPEVMANLER
jgi:hypothetical protein